MMVGDGAVDGCERCAAALARYEAGARKVTVIPPEDPDAVRDRDKAHIDRDLPSLRNRGHWPKDVDDGEDD